MRKLLFESLFRRPFTEQAPSTDDAAVTELATAVGIVLYEGIRQLATATAGTLSRPLE